MASGIPSAQIPIPVGDLVFSPLPTYAHTILLEEKLNGGIVKIIGDRQRTVGGVKVIWRRSKLSGRERVGQKFEKSPIVPEIVAQCQNYPIPYLNTLREPFHILLHYTISKHCRPISIH